MTCNQVNWCSFPDNLMYPYTHCKSQTLRVLESCNLLPPPATYCRPTHPINSRLFLQCNIEPNTFPCIHHTLFITFFHSTIADCDKNKSQKYNVTVCSLNFCWRTLVRGPSCILQLLFSTIANTLALYSWVQCSYLRNCFVMHHILLS